MSTTGAPQPLLPDLPEGLAARPLSLGDAPAVHALLAAEELHDLGTVTVEEADVIGDWQRPSSNISTATVGVFDEAAAEPDLIAYAELTDHENGCAAVHLDHRGRGIGTALALWMQALARARGMERVGMSTPRGSAGDRLLEELGYEVAWESWFLELPAGSRVPDRPLPEAFAVRAAREDEMEAAWSVHQDAFLEWSERGRSSFADWRSRIVDRPGFEPWHLRVCVDDGGAVVGMLLLQMSTEGDERTAYAATLCTRADHRGRGLAQAMLADGFAAATSAGAARCTLGTDSRTGALALYERVGMRVTSTWQHRIITLD